MAGIVQIILLETDLVLKGSVLEAYPVHTILTSFRDAYKQWPVLCVNSLVAFSSVEFTTKKQSADNDFVRIRASFRGFSSFVVV